MSAEVIARHVEHLARLDQQNKLVLCGPFADHPSGLVVVRAKDKAEAEQIAEADPFVQERVRSFEVRIWQIANLENSYLG